MNITDIRLDMIDNPSGKLRAFCSLTFNDEFVVKNFKIIEGNHGLFVAMPSRKLTKPCYKCDNRVFRRANYCDRCGKEFDDRSGNRHSDSGETHSDIAFPIEDDFREKLEDQLIESYHRRRKGGSGVDVEHSKDENYDLLDFDYEGHMEEESDPEDPSGTAGGSGDEDAGAPDEPMTENVFSEPAHALRSSASNPTSGSTESPVLSDADEESDESAALSDLY